MIKSLNGLYQLPNSKLFYHCNSVGEINVKGKDPLYCGTEEEMPLPARALYEKYQSESGPYRTYVVNISETYGMAYTMLFDYSWLEDMGLDVVKDKRIFTALNNAIWELAEQIQETSVPDLHFYVGEGTDPDGYELMLFVPADHLAPTRELQFACVDAIFGVDDPEKDIYKTVLKSIKDELVTDQEQQTKDPAVCKFCYNSQVDCDLTPRE